MRKNASPLEIPLVKPEQKDALLLNQLSLHRKSQRTFKRQPLTIEQISQLLWAAQGILPEGHCTVPSAGAIFLLKFLLQLNSLRLTCPAVCIYLSLLPSN